MYLLYFCLWVIFNGKLTLEIAIFGVIIAAIVFAFTCKFADYSIEKEKRLFKNFYLIIQYIVVLVIETIMLITDRHLILSGQGFVILHQLLDETIIVRTFVLVRRFG